MATRTVTGLPVTEKTVANGNWDTNRQPIDRVVMHTMVGTADSADARFNNPTSKVSTHYGVRLDGSIWHWVDETNTAYADGDYGMNERAIGIEHEDNGDYNGPRTPELYATAGKLLKDICDFYGIPLDRDHIKKHSEVSDKPTSCPDSLDIDRIILIAQGGDVTDQDLQNAISDVLFDERGNLWPKTHPGATINLDSIRNEANNDAANRVAWIKDHSQGQQYGMNARHDADWNDYQTSTIKPVLADNTMMSQKIGELNTEVTDLSVKLAAAQNQPTPVPVTVTKTVEVPAPQPAPTVGGLWGYIKKLWDSIK